MGIALFDLDNTLLAGDSDYAWGDFLVRAGHRRRGQYEVTNDEFYEEYRAGRLDIDAYLSSALRRWASTIRNNWTPGTASTWPMSIQPIMLPRAQALLAGTVRPATTW